MRLRGKVAACQLNIKCYFRLLLFARCPFLFLLTAKRSCVCNWAPLTRLTTRFLPTALTRSTIWLNTHTYIDYVCTYSISVLYFRQSRNRHRAKVSNVADEWWHRGRRRRQRQQWWQLWHWWLQWPLDRSKWRCLATGRWLLYDKGTTSGLCTGHSSAARHTTATTRTTWTEATTRTIKHTTAAA